MGRSAKPPDKRQRRNRRPLQLVKGEAAIQNRPAAPKGVLRSTANEWRQLWDRPIAAVIQPEHFPALERLFLLKDERRRAYRAIRETTENGAGRLSLGSQGQAVLNPLIRYIGELDGEIRQLEDRFGLTPRAGYSLGAKFGEAVHSLQDLNVGMETHGPDAHEDDPRLHREEPE